MERDLKEKKHTILWLSFFLMFYHLDVPVSGSLQKTEEYGNENDRNPFP